MMISLVFEITDSMVSNVWKFNLYTISYRKLIDARPRTRARSASNYKHD